MAGMGRVGCGAAAAVLRCAAVLAAGCGAGRSPVSAASASLRQLHIDEPQLTAATGPSSRLPGQSAPTWPTTCADELSPNVRRLNRQSGLSVLSGMGGTVRSGRSRFTQAGL